MTEPTAPPSETSRLHNEILEGRAQISELRDLLRSENQRANAAIDRETTAEQAAIEAQEERDRLRAVVARLTQMADHWEQQLPEVIRTPAVVSAIRAALEPAAVSVVPPATNQTALLAEDLRYVLGHTEPRHAHEEPGVWDGSGMPCGHCARLAVARQNLAAYDGDPDAVLPAPVDRAAVLHDAAITYAEILGNVPDHSADPRYWQAIRDVIVGLRRLAAEAPTTTKPEPINPWRILGIANCQTPATHNQGCACTAAGVRQDGAQPQEVAHGCPPPGSGVTPCCGRTPFELPRTDRMSTDPAAVTCAPAAQAQPGEEAS